jgi:hypothetical protein
MRVGALSGNRGEHVELGNDCQTVSATAGSGVRICLGNGQRFPRTGVKGDAHLRKVSVPSVENVRRKR